MNSTEEYRTQNWKEEHTKIRRLGGKLRGGEWSTDTKEMKRNLTGRKE